MTRTIMNFLLLALALAIFAPRAAQAAESYDTCAGFIPYLPAVLSTLTSFPFGTISTNFAVQPASLVVEGGQ